MKIRIPYGRGILTADIPDEFRVDIIKPRETAGANDPLGIVQSALDNLVGDVSWQEFSGVKSVAIAVNDKTRPVPHQHLLPPLLQRLADLGIPNKVITLYVAVGTHPPMHPDEFPEILPTDLLLRYRVVSHDSKDDDNLTYLGETARGTPVWSNREYFEADLKIVVGNIEPHQFVGFSGGVKTAAIGLAGLETINHNHALMTLPDSQLGNYDDNPARQDVEEIGQKINVHLALNAILNQHKQIVEVLAGDPVAVMSAGVPRSWLICQVAVQQRYGLVIASPGGHPKDINIYQAQKGLSHAARITRPGGRIILAAACPEGSGSYHYEEWMLGIMSYAEVIQRFKEEGFRIGPHKAYQIARDASQFDLMFYSGLEKNLAQALLLNPVQDFQSAVSTALADLQPGECVGVLPHAVSTIPYLEQ